MSDNQPLPAYPDASDYIVKDLQNVMTPALAIYPDIVKSNIEAMREAGWRRCAALAPTRQNFENFPPSYEDACRPRRRSF